MTIERNEAQNPSDQVELPLLQCEDALNTIRLRPVLVALLVLFFAIAYQFFFDPLDISWLVPTYRDVTNNRARAQYDDATTTQRFDEYYVVCPRVPTQLPGHANPIACVTHTYRKPRKTFKPNYLCSRPYN